MHRQATLQRFCPIYCFTVNFFHRCSKMQLKKLRLQPHKLAAASLFHSLFIKLKVDLLWLYLYLKSRIKATHTGRPAVYFHHTRLASCSNIPILTTPLPVCVLILCSHSEMFFSLLCSHLDWSAEHLFLC